MAVKCPGLGVLTSILMAEPKLKGANALLGGEKTISL